jgi:hypothetical protein
MFSGVKKSLKELNLYERLKHSAAGRVYYRITDPAYGRRLAQETAFYRSLLGRARGCLVFDIGANAGEKARIDVVNILKNKGYKHIVFFEKGRNKIIVLLQMIFSLIRLLLVLRENDNVIVQYPYTPVSAYKMIYNSLIAIVRFRKAHITALIHDVNYFRNVSVKGEALDPRPEVR